MNDSDSSKPQRRRYQFSLRTLLVFVAVVSVVLACTVPYLRWWLDTAPIRRIGGEVLYVHSPEEGQRTLRVVLDGQTFTDASLNEIKGSLERISELIISDTQVTDAGLAHLKGMNELLELHFGGNQFTDAGLVHLKEMTQLLVLSLGGRQFTDAGLVHLKGMTQLERLSFGDNQITDAGLVHLKGMTQLERLYLGDKQITDAGLEHIRGLT